MVYNEKPENFNPKFEIVSCFVEYENKILLLHRWPHMSQGGKWGNPAGKVENGENLIEAMNRELKEETDLDGNREIQFLSTTYIVYPEVDFIYNIYRLTFDTKPVININEKEHQNYLWKTPIEALKMNLILDQDYFVKKYYLE